MSHLETDGSDEVSGPSSVSDPGPRPVVVRRNAGLAALVGAAASAVAIAYLWRATQSGAPLDWVVCAVVALIAAWHLAHLVDARTPLLVADELGVRVRLGHQWRGLPWDAVDQVRVQPARGLLHDGRLMFAPHSLGRALDGLDTRGRRAAGLNQRWYGAALAVPLGLGTRVPVRGAALAAGLVALAGGGTEVVLVEPAQRSRRSAASEPVAPEVEAPAAEGEVVAMPGWSAAEPEPSPEPAGGTLVELPEQRAEVADAELASDDVDRRWAEGDAPADDWTDDRTPDSSHPGTFDRAEGSTGASVSDWTEDSADESVDVGADAPGADTDVDEQRPRVRRRSLLGRVGTAVSRAGRGRGRDVDSPLPDEVDEVDEVEPTTVEAPYDQDEAPYDLDEASAGMPYDQDEASIGMPYDQDESSAGTPYDDDEAGRSVSLLDDWSGPAPEPTDEPTDEQPDAQTGTPTDDDAGPEPQATRPAARALSFRDARHSLRAQIRHGRSTPSLGNAALLPDRAEGATVLPEAAELRRPNAADVDDGRVRPISTLGDPVEPLVVDEFVTEPAYDPVIGPELAAARTRVGLSVDELAERTRIRPHVIESIEVDDFAPCGGDFYARGHLRTLARVLGRDPAPLLEQFEKRYATAPISARRVFEAELATGMTGSMRSTVGGPNWLLLVGVVLVLVLTWGVVRLFSSEPTETLQPVPALNGSAGIAAPKSDGEPAVAPVAVPVKVELVGAHAATQVVVRDRAGTVVWAGRIELGGRHTLRATPPVKVHAEDAGAIEVTVAGVDRGPLGELGTPGDRTYHRAG